MAGGDGDIVEEAKTHRPHGLGVMAGRPRRHEGVVGFLCHDFIDRQHRAAGGAQRRFDEPGDIDVSPSSAIMPSSGRPRGSLDIVLRMAERDGLKHRHRRLLARESGEFLVFQARSIARSRSGRSGWPGGVR